MAQDFTTTALLASIKRRGLIPSTTETYSTADFLAMATEELQSYIVSVLVSLNQEHLVADYDIAVVAGTSTYRLSPRASGERLRAVLVSDGNGNFYPLTRMEPNYQYTAGSATGSPVGFVLADDFVVLVPAPTAATTVRVKYLLRPSALVATTAAATISAIDTGRTVITTTGTIPSTVTTGVRVDVVDNTDPFRPLVIDALTTATTSGTTITLTTALPATVLAGAYVSLAGESPVPQVPVELHSLLAQRTKVAILEALGDKSAQMADAQAEKMRARVVAMMGNRTPGSARYVVNRNGPGFASTSRVRWRR